jgi:hypothetical protein
MRFEIMMRSPEGIRGRPRSARRPRGEGSELEPLSHGREEEGDAEPADGLWWEYTTTTSLEGNIADTTVKATAHDLPGNNRILLSQGN